MKMTKKIMSLAIVFAMVMAMSVTAFAQTVGTADANDKASITISNASKGVTYSIYKLFDASVAGNGPIVYSGTIPADLEDCFETNASGNIIVKAGVTDEALFADLKVWADGKGVENATATIVSDGSTLTFQGLEYGYYVVTTTQGDAAITVTSTNPNATVIDKNSTVAIKDLAKKVKDNDTDGFEELAEVAIGDTVTYQVTFATSNYAVYAEDNNTVSKQIQKYTVADTLPNFLSNVTITSVTVDGVALNPTPVFNNGAFDIDWVDDNGANIYNNGAQVVVTYTAKINENIVVGGADNLNKVTVTWTDEADKTAFLEDTANVHTYKMSVTKTNGQGTTLTGAEFDLYDALTGGTMIKLVKVGDNYRVATAAEAAAEDFTSAKIQIGTAVVEGLDADVTYYLEETVAPDGYNILTARQPVTLEKENAPTDATVEVVNNAGTELPSTGGIGTTIFYALGGLMAVGAGVLLVAKKRMEA